MKEYFSHDHNARHDRKVVALVNKYKSSGYGIFWATNEMMHEEGGELELDDITYAALAKHLNEDPKHIEAVLQDCEAKFLLYTKIDNKLVSSRVIRNLSGIEEKKQIKVEAGIKGGVNSGLSRKMKQIEAEVEAESKQGTKLNKVNNINNININNDFVCYDAEKYILENKQIMEKICIATFKGLEVAKKELRKFHLWLEGKNKYPSTNKAVLAGFESWLLNGDAYKNKYQTQNNLNGIEQPKIKLT